MYTWFIWIFFSCLGHLHILQYATECQLFWPKWLTWFIEELQLPLMKTNRLSLLITIFCFFILLLHNFSIFNFFPNWFLLREQRWYSGESTRLPPNECGPSSYPLLSLHKLACKIHLCLQAILKQHSLKYSFTWCHFFVKFPQLVLCTAHYKDLILETGNHKWKFSGTRLSTFVTE